MASKPSLLAYYVENTLHIQLICWAVIMEIDVQRLCFFLDLRFYADQLIRLFKNYILCEYSVVSVQHMKRIWFGVVWCKRHICLDEKQRRKPCELDTLNTTINLPEWVFTVHFWDELYFLKCYTAKYWHQSLNNC